VYIVVDGTFKVTKKISIPKNNQESVHNIWMDPQEAVKK
jgi:hypothetical protein